MSPPEDATLLDELQAVLDREIPVCAALGIKVCLGHGQPGLRMAMPLERNRNHQRTAFAGSLSTLCTIAGWGATWLELRRLEALGHPAGAAIVIRRGTIKYHEPVTAAEIVARCLPTEAAFRSHFAEMLAEKGQSKLDVLVEIVGSTAERPAVVHKGSYVVLPNADAPAG